MLVLIGALIVFASTLGGFMIAGGQPLVLLHVSEFVVILGVAVGVLIIASPGHVLKEVLHKCLVAIKGKSPTRQDYLQILKLLYDLFLIGRKSGLIALEEHVTNPQNSAVFKRCPAVLDDPERLAFLLNGLKPIIDGKVKPDQVEGLMEAELQAKHVESEHPAHVLQLVGDSLPGIGIVAAVLGIINTMAAIADGPAMVGEKVAAALTGTLLGIFVAYGFVNPLTNRIRFNDGADMMCLSCLKRAVAGFAKGLAPLTAVEIARRSLDPSVKPSAEEMEAAAKDNPPNK